MQPIYQPCVCGSEKKFKYCCLRKSPQELIQQSAQFPIHQCLLARDEWEQHGLAVLFISRHFFDCRFIYGVYLVDTYCLGLKNTYSHANVEREKAIDERRMLETKFALVECDYEDARSLILGAIDYADKVGFQPNEDWHYSRYVVEHDRPYQPRFEFGKDGKPLYIAGPSDESSSIMSKLARVDCDYFVSV